MTPTGTPSNRPPLWTCPECGRSFVTANMSHSCVVRTVEEFFTGHEHLRQLFDALLVFVAEIGPFTTEVVKTRISFTTRARFAAVDRLRHHDMVIHFWLKHELNSPRFHRVEQLGNDWVYYMALASNDDLNEELMEWLQSAYQVGLQQG